MIESINREIIKTVYMNAVKFELKYAYKAERIKLDGDLFSSRNYQEVSDDFRMLAMQLKAMMPETRQDRV